MRALNENAFRINIITELYQKLSNFGEFNSQR